MGGMAGVEITAAADEGGLSPVLFKTDFCLWSLACVRCSPSTCSTSHFYIHAPRSILAKIIIPWGVCRCPPSHPFTIHPHAPVLHANIHLGCPCLLQVSKGWQPNHTPPGGELVFEAYMVDGELNVAAFFDIATPSQVRD